MHQEFVEIGIEQKTDDRVEPVIVVVDPGGEIEHRLVPAGVLVPHSIDEPGWSEA